MAVNLDYESRFIFYIELFHIIAIIISIVFAGVIYIKSKKNCVLYSFFYVHFSILIWLISKVLKSVAPDIYLRWFFICTQYLGVCLLEAAIIEFGYSYLYNKTLSNKKRLLLHILPVTQFIIISTNPYHHLFYRYFTFWKDKFGPVFYYHIAIEYSFILVGIILCGIKLKRIFKKEKRKGIFLIYIAILFPIIINIFYITNLLNKTLDMLKIDVVFDITPISFMISLLIFAYVTFEYSLFHIMPVMKHEILLNTKIPIVICDKKNKIIDSNINVQNFLKSIQDIIDMNSKYDNICFEEEILDNHYMITKKIITDIFNKKYVYIFNDITEYKKLRIINEEKNIELLESNSKLKKKTSLLKETEKIKGTNIVARELHDIIGHSLVLTIKLCETALSKTNKYEYNKDVLKAIHNLDNGMISLKKGFVFTNKNTYSYSELKDEITYIIDTLSTTNIRIKSFFLGRINEIEINKYQAIIRIVKEGITNAIKYSKCNDIIISTNITKEKIEIMIVDNGLGMCNIRKGNGLLGIEERVKKLGGSVNFSSEKDNGFQINVFIKK